MAVSGDVIREGQTVGRYRLVREIGRGGMGIVFEAVHPELGNRVALKVIEPSLANRVRERQRFLREARAAAQTRHVHAVSVLDVGTHEECPYIVMELLEGETLAELLAREAPLTAERIAEVVVPVLSALAAAHDAGVVHRDLKPANIVLARRGGRICHPVLTDFGISKVVTEGSEELTGSHAVLGTIHYMAPEVTRSAERATALSDQYSIGVILFECATGRRPFAGSGPYELMHAIVSGTCPLPSTLCPGLDPGLETIIVRAMRRDPDQRYPTVRSLGAALLSFANAKTWAIWAAEFDVDPERGAATLSDAPVSYPASHPAGGHAAGGHARISRARWIVGAMLAGSAVFSTGWMAAQVTGTSRPTSEGSPGASLTSSGSALAHGVTMTGSECGETSGSLPAAAAAPADSGSCPAASAQVASEPLEPPLSRSVRPRVRHADRAEPTSSKRPSPSANSATLVGAGRPVTGPELGSNNAPIIE